MSWSFVDAFLEPALESRYQQSAGDLSDYLKQLHLLKTLNKHRCSYMQMSEYHKFVNKTSEMTWTDDHDTVDGQNPAPPIMMIIPLFIGF